jgi:class 3 adenylate cyclase
MDVPVAILMMDLAGYSAFTAARGPRPARAAARGFWALGREMTEAFEGTFVKGFAGDDFLALFPTVPLAHACASALMALIPCSAGIGFGPVFAEPGDAWGCEVNAASRAGELSARSGEIVPTAAARGAAPDLF